MHSSYEFKQASSVLYSNINLLELVMIEIYYFSEPLTEVEFLRCVSEVI